MGSKWKEVDLDKIVTFSQGIQVALFPLRVGEYFNSTR